MTTRVFGSPKHTARYLPFNENVHDHAGDTDSFFKNGLMCDVVAVEEEDKMENNYWKDDGNNLLLHLYHHCHILSLHHGWD
mmetsp:Transcript_35917/g.54606  ORF Transcript_35917/g.54606 Transcript_35917/m.54606 type:complete len:81 (+) Transcript_35917:550-792(+)